MSGTDETSTYCVHTVLYESTAAGDRAWEPVGNAEWAEMHVFKDSAGSPSFRMVAWLPDTTEVILNSNLLATSCWNCNAGDFAELVNPNEKVYGFYFPDDQTASETAEAVSAVIASLKEQTKKEPATQPPPPPPVTGPGAAGAVVDAPPTTAGGRRASMAAAVEASANTAELQVVDVSQQVGKLKLAQTDTYMAVGGANAGSPTLSGHALHVTYNEDRACYEGLPAEWKHINQQFGVPLSQVPKTVVPGYEERIPSVLLMMQRHLLGEVEGGTEPPPGSEPGAALKDQVGVFRLAPDAEDCGFAKKQINAGEFAKAEDVNVIANLIKVWFREMPIKLYMDIPEATIYKVAEMCPYSAEKVTAEYHQFAEPSRSLVLWLLDLMSDVVIHEASNKMGAKNMAIVMSPNLYEISAAKMDNPMAAMTMSQKVADFTTRLLGARLLEKRGYDAKVQ